MTVAKVDAVYTVTPCVPPVDPTPTEKSSPSQPIKVAPSSAIPVTAACDHVDLKEIEGTTPFRYICTNEECGKILHTCLGCGDVFLPSDTLGPEKVGFIHECAIGGKDCVTRLNGLQVTDAKTDYHPELVDACDEKDADVPEIVGQPARVAKPQKRKPELSALIQDLDLGHLQKLAADPTKLNIGSRSYLPRQVQAAAKLLLDEKLRQSEGQAARPLTTSKFEPQRESGSRGTQESLLPQASA
jgi:hypothetical protein